MGTERRWPQVAGGPNKQDPFPTALPQQVCTSREPSRPRCNPETPLGRLGVSQAGSSPFPGEGQGGEMDGGGLHSSLQETWCLEILSQSRRYTCGIKREGRSESPSKNIHPCPVPLTASPEETARRGRKVHMLLFI